MVPLTQKVIFLLIPDFAVLGHIYMVRGDTIQMLHGCLCRTSQFHHLAKKWDQITQSAEIRWYRRRRYKYPPGRPGCNPRGDRTKNFF